MFDLILSGVGSLLGILFVLFLVGAPILSMISDFKIATKDYNHKKGGKNAGDDKRTKKTD